MVCDVSLGGSFLALCDIKKVHKYKDPSHGAALGTILSTSKDLVRFEYLNIARDNQVLLRYPSCSQVINHYTSASHHQA